MENLLFSNLEDFTSGIYFRFREPQKDLRIEQFSIL